jgi:hypothetical protein
LQPLDRKPHDVQAQGVGRGTGPNHGRLGSDHTKLKAPQNISPAACGPACVQGLFFSTPRFRTVRLRKISAMSRSAIGRASPDGHGLGPSRGGGKLALPTAARIWESGVSLATGIATGIERRVSAVGFVWDGKLGNYGHSTELQNTRETIVSAFAVRRLPSSGEQPGERRRQIGGGARRFRPFGTA